MKGGIKSDVTDRSWLDFKRLDFPELFSRNLKVIFDDNSFIDDNFFARVLRLFSEISFEETFLSSDCDKWLDRLMKIVFKNLASKQLKFRNKFQITKNLTFLKLTRPALHDNKRFTQRNCDTNPRTIVSQRKTNCNHIRRVRKLAFKLLLKPHSFFLGLLVPSSHV